MRAAQLALVALAAQGCTQLFDPCFGPAQHVKDLRVLAVRADPPEVLYDPNASGAPPVQLTLLVANPNVLDSHFVAGTVCPPTDDRRCPPGSLQLPVAKGRPGEIALTASVPSDLIQAAIAADPLHGYGGVQLQFDFTVTPPLGPPANASKLVVFSENKPGYVPNHGIEVPALRIQRKDQPVAFVGAADLLQVIVGEFIGVTPVLQPGAGAAQAQEAFATVDLSGKTVELREHVSYQLYSTLHARFLEETADEPAPGDPSPADGLVTFEPTFQYQGTLYVVARDGRGGEAWLAVNWVAIDIRFDDRKSDLEVQCAQ